MSENKPEMYKEYDELINGIPDIDVHHIDKLLEEAEPTGEPYLPLDDFFDPLDSKNLIKEDTYSASLSDEDARRIHMFGEF